MNTTATTNHDGPDRFLTVPELIERWPIGRNSTYALSKSPDFPRALVLLRQANGQPRSIRRSALLDPVYAPHPSARSTRLSSASSNSASSSMSLRPRSISGP